METATTKTCNTLRHTISVNDSKNNIVIKISLDDACKNGHQDFSITATYWEIGVRTDRNMLGGGCCHEEILKVRPDLLPFVKLHCCDYTGVPMYAVENGFYHMSNGYFTDNKPLTPEQFKAEFCEYYRINSSQFDALKLCENKLRYAIKIDKLGILDQWKIEADEAIKMLEEMTGNKFLVDSRRTMFTKWTPEEEAREEEREKSGYYTTEQIEARVKSKKEEESAKRYKEIEEERSRDIEKIELEYKVKKAVLDAGLSLENFIFYNHSNQGAFNWRGYGLKLSHEDFTAFMDSEFSKIDGVTWTDKGK